jgi:23S rRNA (adenine2503-C2)-methyltransferase
MSAAGEPAYRASQTLDWIYKKHTANPDEMKNIPAALRDKLKAAFNCAPCSLESRSESGDGTSKLLISLAAGGKIEAALIPSRDRMTFCLSSQVGCAVGCRFCASGASGFERNLDDGEIVSQWLLCVKAAGATPDNVVFMGVGEPMMNLNSLLAALSVITGAEGYGFAQRRVTISTSGFPAGIKKLADTGRQYHLAVSLHAPDDTLRAKIIPQKLRHPVREIVRACNYYREKTGRVVTFEYTLVSGLNDSPEAAEKLAGVCAEAKAKLNIIPYNQTSVHPEFKRPGKDAIRSFEAALKRRGVNALLRTEKGSGVDAACGQLRAGFAES